MISDDLRLLWKIFAPYDQRGTYITPALVQSIIRNLQSLEEQAEAIENSLISPVAMADESLPENVIRIARILNRQGVRPAGNHPDGGAA
ncbi:hypothetical protein FACS1894205_2230 [Alphaproteobacteria bacterium]|nr:hypothetical protein FACS1894205_2230 [Alphaproteobacteria bacterium]